MFDCEPQWLNTKVGFHIKPDKNGCWLEFSHREWKDRSENFPMTSYCWAVYLRLIKKYLETGVVVEYEKRLDV